MYSETNSAKLSKLCLEFHPDKKRNNEYSNADESDGAEGKNSVVDEDFEFKEIQHAYSLIGTNEDRRNYDLRRKFNLGSSTKTRNYYDAFSRYHSSNDQFGGRNSFGPSAVYFTFGDGLSFKFSSGGNGVFQQFQKRYTHNDPFVNANPFGRHQRFGEMNQNDRPRYIQKVSIPLEVLYSGGMIEFNMKTSIVDRWKAAHNGGLIKPALMRASVVVLLTWLRSQKVNWFLSLFLFASMVHAYIPLPPKKTTYSTNIKSGWKGGTKIKYKSNDADVTFILQESSHDTYTRVGNDLHTQVEVSAKQLRRGCTLTINPLCESEEPITLELRPKLKNGQMITIKSHGWPKSSKERGDLLVKICCKCEG
eukprot:CAMPEP_0183719882 /NCGR_PEP_ID=MMETSP0737-20130205/12646_1 /TAXON_ID=385413 /ORGANISM="Thalassiosira miniscula, Strain CCMP1093" /LENGTH=363 /DNA_ID=CAMNT_0025949645 /DNA_START=335 /DNA_END=1427 /DNA_ORIENTATION=-